MAVLDHEVHELTKTAEGAKYGCHNRPPFGLGYWAPSRIYNITKDYEEIHIYVVSDMSRECRFDLSLTDGKCSGCKHQGSGEAYSKMIKEKGKA